ncbi:hypothetical protein X737_30315 [Mesorhizobium sp. L48C026A00]|nr:hypothetical protein X737_30315 [Mesorhizobium sp. L48C026A00]
MAYIAADNEEDLFTAMRFDRGLQERVDKVLMEQFERAKRIIGEHRREVEGIAEALLAKRGTVGGGGRGDHRAAASAQAGRRARQEGGLVMARPASQSAQRYPLTAMLGAEANVRVSDGHRRGEALPRRHGHAGTGGVHRRAAAGNSSPRGKKPDCLEGRILSASFRNPVHP